MNAYILIDHRNFIRIFKFLYIQNRLMNNMLVKGLIDLLENLKFLNHNLFII